MSLPQRGIIVSDLSLQTIIELIQIRKVMEPLLLKPYLHCYNKEILSDFRSRIEQALQNQDYDMLRTLDYDFHKYLYEACSKRHVNKLLSYVSDQFQKMCIRDSIVIEAENTLSPWVFFDFVNKLDPLCGLQLCFPPL